MHVTDERQDTSDDRSIFRAEALAHRGQAQQPGDVVRFAPRWTGALFWVLVATVVAGVVGASVVRIDTELRGIAALDDRGRVVVLLPAALAPRVSPGDEVRLGAAEAEILSTGEVIDPTRVRERYGVDVATASLPLVTSARGGQGVVGEPAVLVDPERVIVALVPGLRALLG